MNIQVIIPVYRPDKKLIKIIERLRVQTLAPTGIHLIWSCEKETDPMMESIRSEYPEIRIMEIDSAEYDHGGSRRRAVRNTACDIFVMMTQDAVPVSDDLIEKLTSPLIRQMEKETGDEDDHTGAVACVYARQMPGSKSSPYEKLARLHN